MERIKLILQVGVYNARKTNKYFRETSEWKSIRGKNKVIWKTPKNYKIWQVIPTDIKINDKYLLVLDESIGSEEEWVEFKKIARGCTRRILWWTKISGD